MAPARLDHAHPLIRHKIGDGAAQKIRLGHKVGIENGNEFAVGFIQTMAQGSGLVALPVGAAHMADVQALRRVVGHPPGGQRHGGIGRIVEHLNVQAVSRVVEGGGGINHAFHHVLLVVERQLHRHAGPLGRGGRGRGQAAGVGP